MACLYLDVKVVVFLVINYQFVSYTSQFKTTPNMKFSIVVKCTSQFQPSYLVTKNLVFSTQWYLFLLANHFFKPVITELVQHLYKSLLLLSLFFLFILFVLFLDSLLQFFVLFLQFLSFLFLLFILQCFLDKHFLSSGSFFNTEWSVIILQSPSECENISAILDVFK